MSDAAARLAALDITRNILLQAPAGSGKTTVLAQRFLGALAEVDAPEQVLAITFTRKAAAEMRERVLLALEGELPPTQADLPRWQELAANVHAHAAQCGWDEAELPARLRIQTIDSLAHEIARAMPLLGRVYTSLHVVDAAGPMYATAARDALRYAEEECPQDLDLLLDRLDNNRSRAEQLLAELLPWRNRWQPLLIEHHPEQLADQVTVSLQRILQQTLADALRLLGTGFVDEAAAIARTTAAHRCDAGHEAGMWAVWLRTEAALTAAPESLEAWRAVVDLALTTEGEPRKVKGINVRLGFPPAEKALKQRWENWSNDWQERAGALRTLQIIRCLPPAIMAAEDRRALAALARLMMLAAQHLKLVFREQGMVDHSEVAAVAQQALRGMDGASDQSIRQTLRVQHLLLDEFQDTSPEQVGLVQDLISGWDASEARSLFLVGDPMQSIYLFRNSEVGLFLQVRGEGIGGIALEARQLGRNFRSQPALVDWANNAFRRIFPAQEDLRTSAIGFLPAEAARTAAASAAVTVWAQPVSDPELEATAIAAEIRTLRARDPHSSIAVLVQTRAVAGPVLRALAAAGIATRGVDLAMLADRSVVRDLVALGQALLDAADRTAWLALLRTPCCGLLLADLKLLCDAAGHGPLLAVLCEAQVVAQLSDDGRARMGRVGPRLLAAWQARGQRDVATLIEGTWCALGGDTAATVAERAVARQFVLALRQLQERQGRVDGAGLQALAGQLRDRSEAASDDPVEVLTIHHAKGLEWDVVFVPGLGKSARADRAPLLRWLQLPGSHGDSDLLLAVHSMGEVASDDALAAYIKTLQSERQRNERVRLLYVAITRARQQLYLSGHAPWSEKEAAAVPAGRSLLQLLWPAVQAEFAAQAPTSLDESGIGGVALQVPWLRLPADHSPVVTASLSPVASLARAGGDAAVLPEFSWVGPVARAMGTVMHEEFERLASAQGAGVLESRLPFCAARLREQGIAAAEAQQCAVAIVRQLQELVMDSQVQWLINASHQAAHSELQLSGIVEGELRSVVIDRTFVDAGARWIIDYKTSQHSGGGLEDFLAREMQRYTPQLRLYAALAGQLGPEPVRTALYFPWLRELREVAT